MTSARSTLTTAVGSGGKGWTIYDGGGQASAPSEPTVLTGTSGNAQVALTWTAPASNGGAAITNYYYKYSSDSGTNWSTPALTGSSSASYTVTGLTNGTAYIFQVAAVNSTGTGSYSASSTSVTAAPPCGAAGNNCYSSTAATTAGVASLSDGTIINYVTANGSFKVWQERNIASGQSAKRILKATGLWASSSDWQQTLTRAGTAFSGTAFTNTTYISQIAGRVCPTNVFIDFTNMTATGKCLYYDIGTGLTTLDGAGTTGVEAQDWLQGWNGAATGAGTGSSYYEGNIKTCADKGMRLPVAYETAIYNPGNLPTGDGITPTWSYNTGVPNATTVGSGWTWTATATSASNTSYFVYGFTTTYAASYQTYNYSGRAVRCVLP